MRCSLRPDPTTYQAAFPLPSDSASSRTADESTAELLLFPGLGLPGASPQGRTKRFPHIGPCLAVPPAPERPWFLLAEHPLSAGGNRKCRHTPAPCARDFRRGTQAYTCETRPHHRGPATYPILLSSRSTVRFGDC